VADLSNLHGEALAKIVAILDAAGLLPPTLPTLPDA
jgi:hypothetical protein